MSNKSKISVVMDEIAAAVDAKRKAQDDILTLDAGLKAAKAVLTEKEKKRASIARVLSWYAFTLKQLAETIITKKVKLTTRDQYTHDPYFLHKHLDMLKDLLADDGFVCIDALDCNEPVLEVSRPEKVDTSKVPHQGLDNKPSNCGH